MLKKLLLPALLVAVAATAFAQGTVLWEENFDATGALPAGWTQVSSASDGGWKVGTTASNSTQSYSIPTRPGFVASTNDDKCNCNKANERLVTPVLDLSAQTGSLFLLFDLHFYNATYQGNKESMQVLASTDGGTTWTNLKTLPGTSAWQNNTNIDISAYSGQAAVQFAFRYDDGGGWLYGAAIDNVKVVVPDNIIRASVSGVRAGKFVQAVPAVLSSYTKIMAGQEIALVGTVNNTGFPTITSYDVLVTRGFVTDTFKFDNVNIEFAKSASFTFPYPTVLGSNAFNFDVQVVNVNGVGDNDPSDNVGSASYNITGVEAQPGRKVVVEEGTGTWCTWCPRGAVMMDYIADNYHDLAIPIAIHNGNSEPMKVTAYDAGFAPLIGGFPGGMVEREAAIDPLGGSPNFEMALIEHLTQPAKILVSQNVEWDPSTRKVNLTSSLQFVEEMNGDFRILVVYTEDGVKGTTSGYAQVNAYSGGGNGPMGGFENLPSPVPASQMVYSHVARALIGGFSGAAGSVPATNPAGSVMSYNTSYTVPAAYNIDNMQAITMVLDNATGRIINAESTAIPFVSTSAPVQEEATIAVSIAPNPVVDVATLTVKVEKTSDVQIRVVDAFGRVVAERNYAGVSGKQFLPFQAGNLANGMYTMVATANGQMVSKPFVIAH